MPLRSSPSDSYEMLRQSQPYQTPHFNPISQISPKHHHHHSFDSYHQTSSLNYGFPSSQQSLSAKTNFNSQESNSSLVSNASWGNRANEKPKHHQSSPYGEQESTLSNFTETPKASNEIGNQNSTGTETTNEQSLKMVFKQENVPKPDYYESKTSFSDLDHERNRDNTTANLNQKDDKYLTSFSPIKKSTSSIDPNVVDPHHSIDMKPKTKFENHDSESSKHLRDFQHDNMKKEHEEKEYHNFPHYQPQLDINSSKPLRYAQESTQQQPDYFYNFPYHEPTLNHTPSSTPLQTQSCVPPQSTPFQPYINMYSQKSSNLTNFEQKIPLHKYPKPTDDENCKLPSKKNFYDFFFCKI